MMSSSIENDSADKTPTEMDAAIDQFISSGKITSGFDSIANEIFNRHVNTLEPTEFLKEPYRPLFCDFFKMKPDEFQKIIEQKNPEKNLLKMGYLLFCENFAYALRTLELTSATFQKQNGKMVCINELKISNDFALKASNALHEMCSNKKNNLLKCLNNNLMEKIAHSNGNIEYRFIHPELISYFYIRKSREMHFSKNSTLTKPTLTNPTSPGIFSPAKPTAMPVTLDVASSEKTTKLRAGRVT